MKVTGIVQMRLITCPRAKERIIKTSFRYRELIKSFVCHFCHCIAASLVGKKILLAITHGTVNCFERSLERMQLLQLPGNICFILRFNVTMSKAIHADKPIYSHYLRRKLWQLFLLKIYFKSVPPWTTFVVEKQLTTLYRGIWCYFVQKHKRSYSCIQTN